MIPPKHSQAIEIESFAGPRTKGVQGPVQLRPIAGQAFASTLLVEGNKSLVQDYPVGSRFKVQVALADRPGGGGQYLFSSWQWDVVVHAQDE
jgi:hypothetical protein